MHPPTSRPGPSSSGAAPNSTTARRSTPKRSSGTSSASRIPRSATPSRVRWCPDVERVTVDDKYTVRFHLKEPDVALDINLIYYPVNLMAPGAVDKADTDPVNCGPFKFKSWRRLDRCELVRFENFWETDAEGNSLPYLDGLIGRPKKEDRVRLTALRTGELDLIDNVAYADAPAFKKDHGKTFDTWPVPQVGTAMMFFNLKNGLLSDKGQSRRPSAAAGDRSRHRSRRHPSGGVQRHRRDRQRVLQHRQPMARRRTSSRRPKFDPDKAKALRKKAKGGDEQLTIIANDTFPYMQQSGELVHAMLKDAGFNVVLEILPTPVMLEKQNKGDFDIDSTANSYRLDPDGWYGRNILSTAPETPPTHRLQEREGRPDHPRRAQGARPGQAPADVCRRRVAGQPDLPMLYTHFVPLMMAGNRARVKGYEPSFSGPWSYAGAGMRRPGSKADRDAGRGRSDARLYAAPHRPARPRPARADGGGIRLRRDAAGLHRRHAGRHRGRRHRGSAQDPRARSTASTSRSMCATSSGSYRAVQFDFGKSLVTRRPISIELLSRIPATVYLATVGHRALHADRRAARHLRRRAAQLRGRLHRAGDVAGRHLDPRVLVRDPLRAAVLALPRLAAVLRLSSARSRISGAACSS